MSGKLIDRLVPALILIVLATACGGASTSANVSGSDQPLNRPIEIGAAPDVLHQTPFQILPNVAKDKYGLDIEVKPFTRYPDIRTAIASGSLDVGVFGPNDLVTLLGQGNSKVIAVAGYATGGDYLMVRSGVTVNDWSDLNGLRMAVAQGGIGWMKLVASLQQHGVAYDAVKTTNLPSAPGMQDALSSKQVDAVQIWDPFGASLAAKGLAYYPKFDIEHSDVLGAWNSIIVMTTDFASNHPKAASKVIEAVFDATHQMTSDLGTWAKVLSFTKLPTDTLIAAESHISYSPALDQARLVKLATFMYKLGIVPKDVSGEIAKAVDYQYVATATGKSPQQLGAT